VTFESLTELWSLMVSPTLQLDTTRTNLAAVGPSYNLEVSVFQPYSFIYWVVCLYNKALPQLAAGGASLNQVRFSSMSSDGSPWSAAAAACAVSHGRSKPSERERLSTPPSSIALKAESATNDVVRRDELVLSSACKNTQTHFQCDWRVS
jgi:hypothetical protein